MKKFVLAAAFAVGTIAFANAQTQQQRCCDDDAWVELNAFIHPILCLYMTCQPDGWVHYDCPPDFQGAQTFMQGPLDPNFTFGFWSNLEFDINVHTHNANFTKPNALGNAIASNNVEVRVAATAGVSDATVQSAYGTLALFPALGTVINSADPSSGGFSLNFRMKPLANAYQYTPGIHRLPVHVTITPD